MMQGQQPLPPSPGGGARHLTSSKASPLARHLTRSKASPEQSLPTFDVKCGEAPRSKASPHLMCSTCSKASLRHLTPSKASPHGVVADTNYCISPLTATTALFSCTCSPPAPSISSSSYDLLIIGPHAPAPHLLPHLLHVIKINSKLCLRHAPTLHPTPFRHLLSPAA
jgi:hypothetical protein